MFFPWNFYSQLNQKEGMFGAKYYDEKHALSSNRDKKKEGETPTKFF